VSAGTAEPTRLAPRMAKSEGKIREQEQNISRMYFTKLRKKSIIVIIRLFYYEVRE
jgi:hypothetical protein